MLWAASLTRNLSIETVVSAMLRCSLLRSHRSSSSSIIFALFISDCEAFVEDSFPISYISCNLERIPFTISNEKTAKIIEELEDRWLLSRLQIKNDKWFGTRSLPECLESTG